jgi:hypothetical protein
MLAVRFDLSSLALAFDVRPVESDGSPRKEQVSSRVVPFKIATSDQSSPFSLRRNKTAVPPTVAASFCANSVRVITAAPTEK